MELFALILICVMKLVIGYDNDAKCFNSNFANITSSDDQGSPQVKLNMKHYHKSQMNFGAVQTTLKSASVAVLERGIKAVFEYRYPTSSFFTDYNPRNLTLLYDGISIYAAIGSLEDRYFQGATTQEWNECEVDTIADNSGTMFMTFYQDSSVYSSGSQQASWEDLEISVNDEPEGPSYDNECARFKGAPLGQDQETEGKSFKVSIKQIHYIYPSTDIERSEQEVSVTSGKATVVEFNQTVAESGHGFQGWKINPRNLTLWINSTGHLDMAIAQLDQSISVTAYGTNYEEEWSCEEGTRLMYCDFNAYSAISGTFTSQSDILEITVTAAGTRRQSHFAFLIVPLTMMFLQQI